MKNRIPRKLLEIYKEFDDCEVCKKQKNPFLHILGGGKFKKPQFLFLFINPTHLNISSHKDYKGKRRYPFIGVRYFYKLLAQAGFVNKKLIDEIYKSGWQIKDEDRIEKSLFKNSVYLTNLVKCAKSNPDNPDKETIGKQFALLKKEINLVLPKYIVTFGKLPFKVLTDRDIRLKDLLSKIGGKVHYPFKSIEIYGKKYKVLPCYFPVGRGNPQKTFEILTYIKKHF